MTLLALEIRIPDTAILTSTQGVLDTLADMFARFGSYFISFFVIATLWRAHLKRYRYLLAVNGHIISWNLLQLLFVGLIPFATTLLNRSSIPIVVCIYAGIILANVLVGWAAWSIASMDPMRLSPEYTVPIRREQNWRSAIAATVFAASMVIAWWSPAGAMYFWAVQIPANLLLVRLARPARAPVPSSVTS